MNPEEFLFFFMLGFTGMYLIMVAIGEGDDK